MSNQDKIREEFRKKFDKKDTRGKPMETDVQGNGWVEGYSKDMADFFLSHTIPKRDVIELIEGMKKKPTQHPIPCPDGNPSCLVYHCEIRLSEEDKKTNKVLDTLLAHPLLKEE